MLQQWYKPVNFPGRVRAWQREIGSGWGHMYELISVQTPLLMYRIQSGNFAGEQWIFRKLVAQRGEDLAGAGVVFVAYVGDRQQDASKRAQIMAAVRSQLQLGDSFLLIPCHAPQ